MVFLTMRAASGSYVADVVDSAVVTHSCPRSTTRVDASLCSVAFLISGTAALVGLYRIGELGQPRTRDWISVMFNFVGCVAFGVSAVGTYVSQTGATADALLANTGTFIGAVGFFAASFVYLLPKRQLATA